MVAGRRSRTSRLGMGLAVILVAAAGCSEPVSLLWVYKGSEPMWSTPLIVEQGAGLVLVGDEAGYLNALELKTGAQKWRFPTLQDVYSAPTATKDGKRILFGSTNYLFYCLDREGALLWKLPTKSRIKSDPVVDGNRVYFTSYDKHVYAATVADGKLAWTFPADPTLATADPATTEAAKADGAKTDEAKTDETKTDEVPPDAARIGAAALVPTPAAPAPTTATAPAVQPGAFSYSSPVIADGVLYVGNLDHYLYALNVKDGSLKWRFATGGEVTSTPLVHQGVVYIGSQDKKLYAVDAATGKEKWQLPTDGKIMSRIALLDGLVYFGSYDQHFYAVDTATGKTRWKYRTGGPIISGAAFDRGMVFFGGGRGDHSFYGLDAATGQEIWKFDNRGGRMDADAVVHNGMLYMACGDRHLYAFKVYGPQKK